VFGQPGRDKEAKMQIEPNQKHLSYLAPLELRVRFNSSVEMAKLRSDVIGFFGPNQDQEHLESVFENEFPNAFGTGWGPINCDCHFHHYCRCWAT
jgi:hypothetical protein